MTSGPKRAIRMGPPCAPPSIPVKGLNTQLIPGRHRISTTLRENGQVQIAPRKGKTMSNKAKATKAAAGGVVALAAGLASTTMLVSQLAGATPVPTHRDGQPPASAS